MFKFLTKLFVGKQQPTVVAKGWKKGMWVMYGEKIAILTDVSIPSEIHLVDTLTGETTEVIQVPLESLRQARYPEIPSSRRMITADKAKELGYGA